ncbi:hypothetical protein [Nonomuraea endophytica]|uniref:Uncharacterized protein n=1 Tax=Nonomuraea endophytica TaxID=714136 RepID=A0A7W8A948_9ACTN|nr:hypothetical protein [Nonomuraea endophytica]MBB5081289.1 hypothetical protein [Nonomuraea endophytica]
MEKATLMARAKPQEQPDEAAPRALFVEPGDDHSTPGAEQAKAPARTGRSREMETTPRRIKQPTERVRLAVRIEPAVNSRLSAACAVTGGGPQKVIEDALNLYFDALGVPKDLPLPKGEREPRERTPRKRTHGTAHLDLVPIGVRVLPLTDARLTYACENMVMGPQDMVETALNAYFMRMRIPHHI